MSERVLVNVWELPSFIALGSCRPLTKVDIKTFHSERVKIDILAVEKLDLESRCRLPLKEASLQRLIKGLSAARGICLWQGTQPAFRCRGKDLFAMNVGAAASFYQLQSA